MVPWCKRLIGGCDEWIWECFNGSLDPGKQSLVCEFVPLSNVWLEAWESGNYYSSSLHFLFATFISLRKERRGFRRSFSHCQDLHSLRPRLAYQSNPNNFTVGLVRFFGREKQQPRSKRNLRTRETFEGTRKRERKRRKEKEREGRGERRRVLLLFRALSSWSLRLTVFR